MTTQMFKIVWINTSPFKDRPELIEGALKAGSQDEACLQFYTGVQLENPDIAAWLSVFTSQADHDALLTGPHPAKAYQSELFAGVNTENGPRVVCANLIKPIDDLEKALATPVSQVIEIQLKPENASKLDELEPILKELDTALADAGARVVSVGRKVGDNGSFVVIVGWDTLKAHGDAVAEGTKCRELITKFEQLAPIAFLKYARFTKYKP